MHTVAATGALKLSWLLLARDLTLVAVTACLAITLRRRAATHLESP